MSTYAYLRRCGVKCVAAMALVLTIAAAAEAGTIRGRLYRKTSQGDAPAQGVPVTVVHPDPRLGRSGVTYSGPDGMYYLYNIPPGRYTLEIWAYPNHPPQVYSIVVGQQAFTDIAPIAVP